MQKKREGSTPGALFRVAVVGAGSLKGREVKDVITDRKFPASDVRLLDDESLGQIEQVGEEATFIQRTLPEQFANVDFAFFASDSEYTLRTWQVAREAGSEIVDLSYALEDERGVQLRAPWVERELGTVQPSLASAPVVIAHPAAIVLALLLVRVSRVSAAKSVVATVLEPASEQGKRGMDELHEQTVDLLSFQQLPMNVYGTQVAFNVVDRYGAGSANSLAAAERRILSHLQKIAGTAAPVPSLMLLQTPTFHAHAFSLYIEFTGAVTLEAVQLALAGDHVVLAVQGEDAPSNVSAAGQDFILASVRADAHRENGFWIWATADNLRLSANSAVECAEMIAAGRPRGQVQ